MVAQEEREGRDQLGFHVLHGVLPVGLLGQRVEVLLELLAVVDQNEYSVDRSRWERHPVPEVSTAAPPNSFSGCRIVITEAAIAASEWESGGDYNAAAHRLYRLVFRLKQAKSSPTAEARMLVVRTRSEPSFLVPPALAQAV
jgi:hypothetical protein